MPRIHVTILGLLIEKPMYGYEMKQQLAHRHLDDWRGVKLSSLYKALQSLEKKEHIEGKIKVSKNNPPRKVYSITESGRKYLRKHIEKALVETKNPNDFLFTTAFMLGATTKEYAYNAIIDRIEKVEEKKVYFNKKEEEHIGNECEIPANWTNLVMLEMDFLDILLKSLYRLKNFLESSESDKYFIKEV